MSFEKFCESNTLDLTPRPPPTGDEIVESMKYRPKVWFVTRALLCWLGRHEWYVIDDQGSLIFESCGFCDALKAMRR